ncbi:aldo/keto reductase [Rhodococcus sp. P1Y]|uniref:aldo/keto reductase n=1 Tax=Rhodococcus sp. P1Y TaxID=1302308 RepID=UPI000EAD06FC|nr:aldo/keto reductase [Rhodococcus sp. P1Y]AYJ48825.1 aldo/keto reductase [Rhodococcus sp. P1Y]
MTQSGRSTDNCREITISGKTVSRLGFGAMRLTGRGIWGAPSDRSECVAVVRRAVELGVQIIDTADSYGPHVSEEIIREAIHPYRDDILIATKAGLTRNGPDVIDTPQGPMRVGPEAWPPVGRPEYLRQQALLSMRRLGVEHIDLFQLHRVDPQVPLDDQVGELKSLQEEGKIRSVGLSQVNVEQIIQAQKITNIESVQNRFNVTDRSSRSVVDYCYTAGIAFIPWAPMAAGQLSSSVKVLAEIGARHDATVGQIAIAWLLALRPNIVPIPGTAQRAHLEQNIESARIGLNEEEMRLITAIS